VDEEETRTRGRRSNATVEGQRTREGESIRMHGCGRRKKNERQDEESGRRA